MSGTSSCLRTDKMRQKHIIAQMSDEEKMALQKSLVEAYTEPIEFYKTLQRRATKNPLFLQRSLKYQIEAKHQRRIQMTMSLSGSIDAAAGAQTQKLCPLYIMLARLVSSKPTPEYTEEYKFSRVCHLSGVDGDSQGQPNFLLPRMDKLALLAKSGSLAILFISFANAQNSQFGIDSGKIDSGTVGGDCLWSKVPLESLYSSWKKYPNMDLGQKVDSVSVVEMQPCFLQLKNQSERSVMIQVPSNPLTSISPQQVQVTISAQEVGATENPPYCSSFSSYDIPSSSVVLPINWLRKGQVAFNYTFYNKNNLYPTEVTQDFTCTICLVKCASFKGLQCHMPSTHDLFNFEFWVYENYPAVNLSLKSETMINESNEDGLNARREPYFSFSKKFRRRKQKTPVRNSRQGPHKTDDADSVKSEKSQIIGESSSQVVTSGKSPADLQMKNMWNSFAKEHCSKKSRRRKQKIPVRNSSSQGLHKTDDADSVKSEKSQTISHGGVESSSQVVTSGTSPADLQMTNMWNSFAKEHCSKKSRRRKQKIPVRISRQGAQKTDDADSVKSEKSQTIPYGGGESSSQVVTSGTSPADLQMKNMWNSFAKEHRVFTDGRVSWGCEEFSKLHGPLMVRDGNLLWCWKKFIWTLRYRGFLDARTVNNCTDFLEQLKLKTQAFI